MDKNGIADLGDLPQLIKEGHMSLETIAAEAFKKSVAHLEAQVEAEKEVPLSEPHTEVIETSGYIEEVNSEEVDEDTDDEVGFMIMEVDCCLTCIHREADPSKKCLHKFLKGIKTKDIQRCTYFKRSPYFEV